MACLMLMTGVGSHNRVDVRGLSNYKKVGSGSGCLGDRRKLGGGFHRWNPERNRVPRLWAQTVRKEEQEEEGVVMDAGREEKFDWNKAWYPVRLVADLEPKKPTAVELLGRQFVLWRDKNEEWRCFKNVCPHRLARLSEGRIEASDGTLVCSYHGWRFDEEGSCKLIPQQETPPPGGLSERSSVMSFPVKIESQTVWIWPDESQSAFIDSAMIEPNGAEYEDLFEPGNIYTREVPYPVDILIENLIDPSHAAHAHHGLLGNRDEEGWMKGKSHKPDNRSVVKFTLKSLKNADKPGKKQAILVTDVKFVPPGFISFAWRSEEQAEALSYLLMHSVPTSASSSRVFLEQRFPKRASRWYLKLKSKVVRPRWVRHLRMNSILDGDTAFLAEQGNMMRSAEDAGIPWESQYYTPATSDLGVNLFRRWFHNGAGGGGPKLPDGQPLLQGNYRVPKRADLLERYESHTKNCAVCSNALWWVRFWKVAAQALSCILGALGLMTATQSQAGIVQGVVKFWSVFASSLAAAGVAYGLQRLEKIFIFKDYEQWKT